MAAWPFDFNASGYPNPQLQSETSSLVFKDDVVGRDDDKNTVVMNLMSEEFDWEGDISCMPIVSMSRLGKTTLA
ncbi:hypothetical protein U1Q18_014122 [Sarracenia purpurea var. burkii]